MLRLDPSAGKHGWINFLTSSLGWIPFRQPYAKPKLCARLSIFPSLRKSIKLARAPRCFTAGWTGMLPQRAGRAGRGPRALLAREDREFQPRGDYPQMRLFVTVWAERPSPARVSLWLCPGEAAGWLGKSFMARMDFLRSRVTVSPVLLPVCCHPPDGSRGQTREEQLRGLQFAAGSSQPGEGGDEAAAEPGPSSWGNGLRGEALGPHTAPRRGSRGALRSGPAVPPWRWAAARSWCLFVTSRFKQIKGLFSQPALLNLGQ